MVRLPPQVSLFWQEMTTSRTWIDLLFLNPTAIAARISWQSLPCLHLMVLILDGIRSILVSLPLPLTHGLWIWGFVNAGVAMPMTTISKTSFLTKDAWKKKKREIRLKLPAGVTDYTKHLTLLRCDLKYSIILNTVGVLLMHEPTDHSADSSLFLIHLNHKSSDIIAECKHT